MTVNDLIEDAKRRARDTGVDPLWYDDELVAYLNWAEQEACRRANLIYDESMLDVCIVSLGASSGWTPLHRLVLKVDTVWFGSTALWPFDKNLMDIANRTWESETGTPGAYAISADSIRLYPNNQNSGTLTMRVSRLPKVDMAADELDRSPEIPQQFHEALVSGMLHKAFLKNDSETYNKGASDLHLAEFERIFGPAVPALSESMRRNSEHVGSRTRSEGFAPPVEAPANG